MSESRYDADRSGEESEMFIDAPEDVPETPAHRESSDSVFFTPDSTLGKENVTPKAALSPLKASTADGAACSASPSVRAGSTAKSSTVEERTSSPNFVASTPRKKSPVKKALDKRTPCLCGTAKCRGFLMT